MSDQYTVLCLLCPHGAYLTLHYSENVIYKSINQISIAPISPAKPGSVVQQLNQSSAVNWKKQFRYINEPSGMPVSMKQRPI